MAAQPPLCDTGRKTGNAVLSGADGRTRRGFDRQGGNGFLRAMRAIARTGGGPRGQIASFGCSVHRKETA